MKRSLLLVLCLMTCLFYLAVQTDAHAFGVMKKRPKPNEYGKVIIDNYSTKSGKVAPVVFQHWLHRARYTCRLWRTNRNSARKEWGSLMSGSLKTISA